MTTELDPTTQSNYTKVATTHLDLDWEVDFHASVIKGSATHTLYVKEDGVTEVILDTTALDISKVEVEGKEAKFELGQPHKVMGSALKIHLATSPKCCTHIKATIYYKTTDKSTAVQWLEKEQTQGNKFPFMFSQCQPINARSLAPCADSPSVKITYGSKIKSVLPALMSAIRVSPPLDGPPHDGKEVGKDVVTYVYNQPIPIPTYLIAIAVGDLVFRSFPNVPGKSWTSGIWAEPLSIDSAYHEFSEDTGKFLAKEEEYVPPYRFGVYDMLVLPPSFPFGGMENACLTFLTPTLLVGDRSLVDVVVHEMTHSWFGNGITHAHATHFWLNEGWTTYMERVLQEKLHSPAHRGFAYIIGYKGLVTDLKTFDKDPKTRKYQRLVIGMEVGEDPELAYSQVPYDKGANFILYIERTLGGLDVFLPYIYDYVSTFQGKSITTWQWKDHLYGYYKKHNPEKVKALDSIDWDAWLSGEGTELPVKMEYDSTLATEAWDLAQRWDASRDISDLTRLPFKESDMEGFDSNQKVAFLDRLNDYEPLPPYHIQHLGHLYGSSTTPNAEIRYRFYLIALKDPHSQLAHKFAEDAAKWVVGADGSGVVKGRNKFCRPVFTAVFGVDKQLARDTYLEHKKLFHPISQKLLEKDLGL